jgi:tRNA-intron endonuclease
MTAVGELLRDSVVVWDVEEGSKLYAEGFYGKPLGTPKPKELKLTRR